MSKDVKHVALLSNAALEELGTPRAKEELANRKARVDAAAKVIDKLKKEARS
jgi:hypothetical protein